MRDLAESLAYLWRERLRQGKKRAGKKAPTTSWFFFSCFPPLRHWGLGLIMVRHFPKKCGNAAMPRSGKNTIKRNISYNYKLNIKSGNWCNSTLVFIGFAIESISSGPPFLKSCVTLVHITVFAGQSPTFPTIKPIKIYTFRILGRRSWEKQRKTVSESSR